MSTGILQRLPLQHLLWAAVLAAVAGCGATRAYTGPSRSAEQVSRIEFHTTGEITLSEATVDSTRLQLFSSAAEVLPGSHSLELEYSFDEAECDAYDGLCEVTTYYGTCTATLRTLPGRSYLVTLARKLSLAEVRIAAKGYFDLSAREDEADPGAGSCREERTGFTIRRDPDKRSK